MKEEQSISNNPSEDKSLKAITLSGQRIIQESALVANREMNKEIKNAK